MDINQIRLVIALKSKDIMKNIHSILYSRRIKVEEKINVNRRQ